MQVTFPNGSVQEVPLFDLGGFPVVWLGSSVGQDPNQGGLNAYGPGAVLKDSAGSYYQIEGDWSIRPMGSAASPPSVPQNTGSGNSGPLWLPGRADLAATAQQQQQNQSNGGKQTNLPAHNVSTAGSTLGTLESFFGQNLRLGTGFAVPYWTIAAAGLGGVYLSKRHRRRR